MKILWLTWKDLSNPLAGGAEVVNEELAQRLVDGGHKVTFLVSGYKGALDEEVRNGVRIIRVGSRYTVYFHAWLYYGAKLKGQFDLVIDEVNTMPFFAKYYVQEPSILFVHMLCRKIWFYQFPWPLSVLGYIVEPIYLRLISRMKIITVSKSTKNDLIRYGGRRDQIHIISEGIELEPVNNLASIQKFDQPTLLSFGSVRAMKQTLHQIRAYEIAKPNIPNLKLKIAGETESTYGRKVLEYIQKSPYASDIEYLGRVTKAQKIELMQKSHLILVTSVKEGWGLIVTEAASQGTPAVVYDVDGLRDSVCHDCTGLIASHNTPESLAYEMNRILEDNFLYERLRHEGWRWSQELTFDISFKQFLAVITTIKTNSYKARLSSDT